MKKIRVALSYTQDMPHSIHSLVTWLSGKFGVENIAEVKRGSITTAVKINVRTGQAETFREQLMDKFKTDPVANAIRKQFLIFQILPGPGSLFIRLSGNFSLASVETAAIKTEHAYVWYKVVKKMLGIELRGKERDLRPGDIIGLRKSSNGKTSRMVMRDKINVVMSPTNEQIQYILKRVEPLIGGPIDPAKVSTAPARKPTERVLASTTFNGVRDGQTLTGEYEVLKTKVSVTVSMAFPQLNTVSDNYVLVKHILSFKEYDGQDSAIEQARNLIMSTFKTVGINGRWI